MIAGIACGHLPSELGCSGVTAWRRLRDWQVAGVWERLHAALLEKLNAAGAIDWSAAVVDGSHIRALQGGLDRAVSG
jgi:transposase